MVSSKAQGMNPGGFSLAGAVDLEGVKRRVEAQAKQAAKAASGSTGSSAPKAGGYVQFASHRAWQL